MRNLDPTMSPEAVTQVDALLRQVRIDHQVHIPLAIESGSRAWGFPSPDSDYDCRFIYVRPAAQSLSIWPKRDVIEMPLVGDMDVNGWDLSKALRLLLKGNAVVVEWLNSPIVYSGDIIFRDEMLSFANTWLDRGRIVTHYLHLGRRQLDVHLENDGTIPLKKLFYALRPAMALRWLRLHAGSAVAPMSLSVLVDEAETPRALRAQLTELVELKASTREMGRGQAPSVLIEFIQQELEHGVQFAGSTLPIADEAMVAADALYERTTRRLDLSL